MKNEESIPTSTKEGKVPVLERLKEFNEQELFAVLSTIEPGPMPYTSLISFALTDDLRHAIFVTPKDTRKYKNILESGRVALLMDNRCEKKGDIMATEALTIIGKARPTGKGRQWEALVAIFLGKHPNLGEFVRAQSTALIKVTIEECIHVGQFQTVSTWKWGGPRDGE